VAEHSFLACEDVAAKLELDNPNYPNGLLLERDMIAVRVADELRLVVIASRAYLEGHGRPKTPHDLLSVIQLPAMPPPNRPNPLIRTNLLRSAGPRGRAVSSVPG